MLQRYCVAVLCFLLLLSSCAEVPNEPDKIKLSPVTFSDLPNWNNDALSEAVPALLRSCAVVTKVDRNKNLGMAGKAADWVPFCTELANLSMPNDATLRALLENKLRPYAAESTKGSDGLFTGYYEPLLHASLQQGGPYQTPLYARPDDLISVDLGDFKSELHGQRIVGKVENRKLKPYDDRAAIAVGSLDKRAQILAFVDDSVDAFFMAVQGSGILQLTDGSIMRIGYDGANGRAYVAIGRAMADKGLIEKPVTMQKIRAWLKVNPERSNEIMNLNPSFVFFKKIEGDGPVGAQGVALTPQRSLAVDPAFISLGVPVWLDTTNGSGAPLQRLMVAQDTGGAIKGTVRGDFFWGSGDKAATQAGAMQNKGHYYVLLPKTVVVDR